MGGTVGKQATLLLRWKMNVPETKAATDVFEKKNKKPNKALNMSKMKEVETHTCRSCTFQMQKMRHKPMEKNFCLLPLKNQRKTSSFVLLVFLVLLSPASPFSSLFSFTVMKGSKKKTSMFPCYLCFHSLPLLRFSFLSLAVFSVFFSPFFLLFFCSHFPFFTPFPRSLEELIYNLTYLYLGKI
jgi:hypothetical protein